MKPALIFASLLALGGCGMNTASTLKQNARPDDSTVNVIRVRDGSNIRFVMVSQGRGYELVCDRQDKLLALIEATGYPSQLINSFPALSIDSDVVTKLSIAQQPQLNCESKDSGFTLYKSTISNETKYFFAPKDTSNLFMFGCQALPEAMGFKLDSAYDLPDYIISQGFFDASDKNDINCLRGVKIGARAQFESGSDLTLSAVPGTVVKPQTFTARNPDGSFAPLTVTSKGACEWLETIRTAHSVILRGTVTSRIRNTSCEATVTASVGTLMQEQKTLKIQACTGFSTLDSKGQCQAVAQRWKTLEAQPVNDSNILGVSFLDNGEAWIANANGSIMHSVDQGATWMQQNSGTSVPLEDIAFLNPNFGLAVGVGILRTTDGGKKWVSVPVGNYGYLTSIAIQDESYAWVGASNGVLFTTDGGQNWTLGRLPDFGQVWSISFTSRLSGWAVGEAGQVAVTDDGGVNWTKVTLPTTDYLRSVYFLNESLGWILGSSGQLFRTVDGGFSWKAIEVTTTGSGGFEVVKFITPLIGWVTANNGSLYFTRNGGLAWDRIETGTGGWITGLSMSDSAHGMAVTFNGKVLAPILK